MRLKPEMPLQCMTNTTSAVEATYDDGPQESESICFETTIECHVALDVHAILQYSGIAIICFHTMEPREI